MIPFQCACVRIKLKRDVKVRKSRTKVVGAALSADVDAPTEREVLCGA